MISSNLTIANALASCGRVVKNDNPEVTLRAIVKYLGDATNGLSMAKARYQKAGLDDGVLARLISSVNQETAKVLEKMNDKPKFSIGDYLGYVNRNGDKVCGVVRKIIHNGHEYLYHIWPVKDPPSGYESVSLDRKIDEFDVKKVR